MAVNPVSLCADLQAWHSAGLSFLYFPEVEAEALLSAPTTRSEAKAATPSQAQPNMPSDARKQPFAASSGNAQAEAYLSQKNSPAGQSGGRTGVSAPAAAGQSRESASVNRNAAMNIAKVPLADHSNSAVSPDAPTGPASDATPTAQSNQARPASAVLPEHWRALAPKLRPAPVIWTYLELGQDLLVKGDPARSNTLKELISSLGLQKGTSSFLPLSVPQGAQDGSEAWCFQSLLGQLGGRVVIVLGADSLAKSPYAANGLACFQERIVQGRMVLCLPSFAELLADPDRFQATKVFLRSAFTKINIL